MRLSLSELKLLVIDEISMVSNTALHHIHQRLKEIFATSDSQLFAGLSVIALDIDRELATVRSETGGLDHDIFVKETARTNVSCIDRQMSITLLNVRSLKKHSLYIKFHFSIFNSDLIALTETLFLPQTNDNDIKDHLEPFTI
ncbi:unnamed protein product [Pocillopora meandrina]|uniref:DNA helicase n=1 Tax=Pocillopora meandrina TaxID=46732 RepID=A0AAU9WXF3_9CNID|nr:unnamed protein product [Pocillopora meandrina]